MRLSCPACNRMIAQDRGSGLESVSGARVVVAENQAPRIECPCGHVVIVVKESQT